MKSKILGIMGIVGLLFAGCSSEDDILSSFHNDPDAVHITAEVGKASADGFTRSNPLGTPDEQKTFNNGDMISVKADGQETVTYKLNKSEWEPQGGKFLKWESESMKFTAYYPATYTGGTPTQTLEYNDVADLVAADYMSFSDSIDKPKDNNALTLTMERQMARVVVEIKGFNNQYASGTEVNSVTINGTVKALKQGNMFYALMVPCATKQDDKEFLSLEVGTGNTKETLKGIPELVAGKSYTYQLTVGKNKVVVNGITVANWTTGEITGGKAELYVPYVTFTANGKQTFKMTTNVDYTISGLQYSVNFGKWEDVVKDKEVDFGGDKGNLRLRGTNQYGTAPAWGKYSTITFIEPSVKVACTGDIRTLLDWRNYENVATDQASFCNLFSDCEALTSAPKLPATILAETCYQNMFQKCTSLTSAPELPATTLKAYCYQNMFSGCTSLESAPKMSAEILAQHCCENMFFNCTSLTSAPELSATELAYSCYAGMFAKCTSLTSAPKLPATKLEDLCYSCIFFGCSKLSSVTMLAPSDQISGSPFNAWLVNAGTDENITRTLTLADVAAYNALESKYVLPGNWKKDDGKCTVSYSGK